MQLDHWDEDKYGPLTETSMEGMSVVLEVGDTLVVPKGMVHSAEVVGNEPVVSLDAILVSY